MGFQGGFWGFLGFLGVQVFCCFSGGGGGGLGLRLLGLGSNFESFVAQETWFRVGGFGVLGSSPGVLEAGRLRLSGL